MQNSEAIDAENDDKQNTWGLIRPLLCKYMLPDAWILVPAVAAGIIAASAGTGMPLVIQNVLPMVFSDAQLPACVAQWVQDTWHPEDMQTAKLWVAVLIVPALMIMRGIGTYFNSYLLTWLGTRMLRRMWAEMFRKLQTLSFSFFDRCKRGEIMTTVIQFTQNVQGQMVTIMNDLVLQPLTLLFAGGYLVYAAMSSHESAILLGNLLVAALVVPAVRMVGRRMVQRMSQALISSMSITNVVEETLTAQREVRAFNLEARRTRDLHDLINMYNGRILRLNAWSLSVAPLVEICSTLALSYSLYCGCGDGLTLEQFAAIATAFYFCYDPFKRLSALANQVQVTGTLIKRINTLLHAKDETPRPKYPVPLPQPTRGEVEFDGVDFAYLPGEPVLHELNVKVRPGEIVALVGPSGSGKTTFINLICRFYDVNKGCVRIDGVDVRDIEHHELMNSIALVSQFSALFHDSIRENIRVGQPQATDEQVRAAGDSARVSEFANELPGGYGYELSEGGGGLSGGQRQRVSVARAFLKNAPILILDEATSALDMKSEACVQEALEELAHGHTTFIIAHRFSTIRMARRILVFEHGRIIADGTHARLYTDCALYRSLYEEQVHVAAIKGKGVTA